MYLCTLPNYSQLFYYYVRTMYCLIVYVTLLLKHYIISHPSIRFSKYSKYISSEFINLYQRFFTVYLFIHYTLITTTTKLFLTNDFITMASSAPTSPIIANLISVSSNKNNQQQEQHPNTTSMNRYRRQSSTSSTTDSAHINPNNNNNYTSSPINATTSNNSSNSVDSGNYTTTSEEEEGSLLPDTTSTHTTDDDKSTKSRKVKIDTKNFGSKTASGHSRIFNCKLCQRAFTREEHLTRHVQSTHNKLKPFVCGICTRPFSRRDLLLRHAKNLHDGSEKAISRIRRSYKNKTHEETAKLKGERGGLLGNGPGLLGGAGNGSRLIGVRGPRGVSITDDTGPSEEEEEEEEEEEMYSNRRILSSLVNNNNNHHHTAASPTASALGSPIDESPETKRLKMSVNMLVS